MIRLIPFWNIYGRKIKQAKNKSNSSIHVLIPKAAHPFIPIASVNRWTVSPKSFGIFLSHSTEKLVTGPLLEVSGVSENFWWFPFVVCENFNKPLNVVLQEIVKNLLSSGKFSWRDSLVVSESFWCQKTMHNGGITFFVNFILSDSPGIFLGNLSLSKNP